MLLSADCGVPIVVKDRRGSEPAKLVQVVHEELPGAPTTYVLSGKEGKERLLCTTPDAPEVISHGWALLVNARGDAMSRPPTNNEDPLGHHGLPAVGTIYTSVRCTLGPCSDGLG
jgi:hypothetical protein